MKKFVSIVFLFALVVFSSPSVFADEMDDWRTTVVTRVLENKTYPRSAIEQEVEGRAIVLLSIKSSDGTILNYDILQASGELILDREIPRIIYRTENLPAAPVDEDVSTIVVPFVWSLN